MSGSRRKRSPARKPAEVINLKRERVSEMNPDALFADGHDDAIIGIAERFGMPPVACYDQELVLKELMKDMDRDQAQEFFDFNIIGAGMGENTPVFVTLF